MTTSEIPRKSLDATARALWIRDWPQHYSSPGRNWTVDYRIEMEQQATDEWDAGFVSPDAVVRYRDHARKLLTPAAPFLKAQALREQAQSIKDNAPSDGMVHVDDVVENMRDDADELEAQA